MPGVRSTGGHHRPPSNRHNHAVVLGVVVATIAVVGTAVVLARPGGRTADGPVFNAPVGDWPAVSAPVLPPVPPPGQASAAPPSKAADRAPSRTAAPRTVPPSRRPSTPGTTAPPPDRDDDGDRDRRWSRDRRWGDGDERWGDGDGRWGGSWGGWGRRGR
jgi:hypothetical protein